VWVVNRGLALARVQKKRQVEVEILALDGRVVYHQTVGAQTPPNQSRRVLSLAGTLGGQREVVFLRLVLSDGEGAVLSRNVYWVARDTDVLDWDNSNWFYTPVSKYANYTALGRLPAANVSVEAVKVGADGVAVTLENKSGTPAFFINLELVDGQGGDVLPLSWEDNYVTLWPKETLTLRAKRTEGRTWQPAAVVVEGRNVATTTVKLGDL
jgi:exo-1,4-beta-D-glucosaminidase